jgi:hypothetical protein
MRSAVPVRTRGRPTQRRPNRCRLEVEVLEARSLPSVQVLATLGEPVPQADGPLAAGAGFRINDFEPNGLNNRGDVLYADDLGTANDPNTFYGEGIFLQSHGGEALLARAGASAPGGGTFDQIFEGPSSLNDQGDVAFDFTLQPAGAPFGVNAGAYRYSHSTHAVTAVVVPGVTPVPGDEMHSFAGVGFNPSLNNRGALVFPGIVPTDQGIHAPGEAYIGLGEGLYQADRKGNISPVVVPGDAAPGGGTFDFAAAPSVNDGGDVAFQGHVAGEEVSAGPNFPPQAALISALGSVYVKDGATGHITSIAHAGDPAPGGGTLRQALFPQINNRGDVLFTGDLTPAPDANKVLGVFLYSHGVIMAIARPGDTMPGGGHLVTASVGGGNTHMNNQDDVVFNGVLDTDVNHDGTLDTGLFEWSHGKLSLVARTGTVLPGVGTVQDLVMGVTIVPPPPLLVPNSGALINDRGQVLFGARLTDGRSVLLLDTPTGQGDPAGGAHADLAILLARDRDSPSAGHATSVNVEHASTTGQPLVPPAGRDDSRSGAAPAQVASRAGTPREHAVDALFADHGSKAFDDPFANGTI